MNQVIDFSALIWVKNELEETLREARQALESHVDNPDDQAQLGFLSAHLHQVYGTLQMVELYGAALLAEEMEHVAKAIASKSVSKHDEACEVLMRAILQLPDYLDRLIAGYRDIPLVLLPILNDLRAVRGATLLSDNAMFSPDLDADLPKDVGSLESSDDLRSFAKELRHKFQIGLLGLLRGKNTDQSLHSMAQVLKELLGMSVRAEVSRLWWVAGGIVESLRDESLEATVALKRLFGQLDREIKRIADSGETRVAEEPALDLIKNLLFYAAQSTGHGSEISSIKSVYKLADLLPSKDELEAARESISGQNADLFATVSVAVKEELTRLKETLDIVLRSASREAEEMSPLVDSLSSLGDTLGMLSLDAARKAMLAKANDLRAYTEENKVPPETLIMDVASTLLFVESSVDGLGTGRSSSGSECSAKDQMAKTEYDQVMTVVLQEAIADLGRGKEAIVSYAASPEQPDQLEQVPQLFNQVKGGLLLLGEARAASLVGAISKYISSELIRKKVQPPQNELDSLADSICGLEYYLEGRKDHRMFGGAAINIAEESVERLGYPPEANDADNVDDETKNENINDGNFCGEANSDECKQLSGSCDGEEKLPEQKHGDDMEQVHREEINQDANLSVDAWDADSGLVESENDSAGIHTLAEPDLSEFGETNEEGYVEPALKDNTYASEKISEVQEKAIEIIPSDVISIDHDEQDGLSVIGEDTDEEILEIFLEEADEVVESINEQLPLWIDNPEDSDALTSLRRSYHTLKGSGRLVGAMRIGEFAWAFETMLNKLIEKAISVSPEMLDILDAAGTALPELVLQIKAGSPVTQPVAYLMKCAEALSKGEPLPSAPEDRCQTRAATDEMVLCSNDSNDAAVSTDEKDPEASELVEEEALEKQPGDMNQEEPAYFSEKPEDNVMDSMLYEIFSAESRGHLEVIRQYLNKVAAGDARVDDLLARALHTLHGSAHMANAHAIADLSGELERYVKALLSADMPMTEQGCDLLQQSAQVIESMLDCLPMVLNTPDNFDAMLSEVRQLRDAVPVKEKESQSSNYDSDVEIYNGAESVDIEDNERSEFEEEENQSLDSDSDQELIDIFLEKSHESLDVCDAALSRWSKNPEDIAPLSDYRREVESLDGNSRMTGFPQIGDLSQVLGSLLEKCAECPSGVSDVIVDGCAKVNAAIAGMLDQIRNHLEIESADKLVTELEEIQASGAWSNASSMEKGVDAVNQLEFAQEEITAGGENEADEETVDQYSEIDPEMLEVFLEEATDILENSETSLREWKRNPEEKSHITQLQRELHTLKGGARMADITVIGDLAHAVESLMVNVSDGKVQASESMFVALHRAHDTLSDMVDRVKNHHPLSQSENLIRDLGELQSGESKLIEVSGAESASAVTKSNEDGSEDTDSITHDRRSKERSKQELVRVKAKLLDNMVNYAGEVSIYRSRLEQKVGAYRFNLVEMEQTISRLREQLRKMEIETEAQVLFRYETETVNSVEQFDPLEMDRYSHMQQLSRSLVESVSDLGSIQNLLENLTSESETLLLQQSRVNTELQEGLMRTRMVPFLGLAARMRRIVRQTCQTVGKKAELELSGAEGEMDRTVVDRVIAPIEHMLRNAVSHGIEAPQDRKAAGKPESGTISIALERESSDVVLRITDDGAGIDLKAIRSKAVERGLMSGDDGVSDDEALQFILETGFSTAEKVTQVAGRGVGMDVVNSEVKQLGGSLHIASEYGVGTTFTMRLPFTLALNQALLVEVGEDTYAIPLSSIEGIVRMPREDLAGYHDNKDSRFSYGGYDYKVSHLGTLLGNGAFHVDGGSKRVPVLLARVGEHCVAFQVENLLGSREIVVKSVGPQISTVRGVSGATILGDGRVIMILDLVALMRSGATTNPLADVESIIHRPLSTKQLTVMVVDDSITVRKVTTRLLERNDMKVISAKDGVDAVAKLQENIPDIMLLDIEMPRMDGFELATHVRNESRLKDIPIIMITSRTGDKHRQRAMQIGVNRYLGKPFQEAELLENIRGLLDSQQ